MKKLFLLSSLAFLFISCIGQDKKPASPRETVKNDHYSVSYGRPYMKGRVVFGDLVKYGEVWRTGANEATEITFMHDMMFAGKPVKAGTYSLFTVPGKDQWTVILNPELKQWGAYGYEKIKAKNAVEATVPVTMLNSPVEQLTLTPAANGLTIAWDKTSVMIPVSMQ